MGRRGTALTLGRVLWIQRVAHHLWGSAAGKEATNIIRQAEGGLCASRPSPTPRSCSELTFLFTTQLKGVLRESSPQPRPSAGPRPPSHRQPRQYRGHRQTPRPSTPPHGIPQPDGARCGRIAAAPNPPQPLTSARWRKRKGGTGRGREVPQLSRELGRGLD